MASTSQPKLLRLHTLMPSQLPSHPTLASAQTPGSTPDLIPFIQQILSEASALVDTDLQNKSLFRSKGSKPSKPSNASVEVLTHKRGSENWFARRSLHSTEEVTWGEFEGGLCDEHSVHEADYTPSVFDRREILRWDLGQESVEGWRGVEMFVYEMCHHIPFPLYNRVFTTLVVTAKSAFSNASPSFIVAQVPLDLTSIPAAIYSTGKNKTEGTTPRQRKKVVLGQYVSVERCKIDGDGKVVWEMGTASDAKGWLPMAIQKTALPGAIIKDVGWFVEWTFGRRPSGRGEAKVTSGGAAS